MTILDLINKSAVMLNIAEVLNDNNLSMLNSTNEQEILSSNFSLNRLYQFAKVVISEISAYQPIIKQVEVASVNKQIMYSVLINMSKIIGIKNEYGYVKGLFLEDCVQLDEDDTYTVIYTEKIVINSLLDEINLPLDEIGEDVLIQGLNAYYCLATGLFQEFNVYNANYSNKLNKLKNLKVFAMPCRSWQ